MSGRNSASDQWPAGSSGRPRERLERALGGSTRSSEQPFYVFCLASLRIDVVGKQIGSPFFGGSPSTGSGPRNARLMKPARCHTRRRGQSLPNGSVVRHSKIRPHLSEWGQNRRPSQPRHISFRQLRDIGPREHPLVKPSNCLAPPRPRSTDSDSPVQINQPA
jgi:hypothetical protein